MPNNVIDISKIKSICKNYLDIINYEYDYRDKITLDLIYWYKEVIFSSNLDNLYTLEVLEELDKDIYKYISNFKYQLFLKKKIKESNYNFNSFADVNKIINLILNVTYLYLNNEIFSFHKSKWI